MPPTITLVSGDPREEQAREQLQRLLDQYDLTNWQLTDAVRTDQAAIPHSSPIITLNTRYLDNDHRALAVYLHEQLHWLAPPWRQEVIGAIDELRRRFPVVPSFDSGGARDVLSTYLHLVVCPLEYASLTEVLGPIAALTTIDSMDFYTWIYQNTLRQWNYFADLLARHRLEPAGERLAEAHAVIAKPLPAPGTYAIQTRRVEPILLASARERVR